MKIFPVISTLGILLLLSCQKEDPEYEFRVDERVRFYVDDFFKEAQLHGVEIPKENLIIEFGEVSSSEYCGQCERPKNDRKGQRIVRLNSSRECWDTEPSQNKEALVFHELGHCLLGRNHKDDLFPSGAPKSIMTTILDGPYQPCIYVFDDQEYLKKCNLTVRRAYYMNELFNENLDTFPDWASDSTP